MKRIRIISPVNTHKDIVKRIYLVLCDRPDLQISENLATGSDCIPQVLVLVCSVIGPSQVVGVVDELLAQPLGRHVQITGLMTQGSVPGL